MPQLTIYGSGDDTFGCYGLPIDRYQNEDGTAAYDDYDCCGNHEQPLQARATSAAEGVTLYVIAIYSGAWAFAIFPDPGDDPMRFPHWQLDRLWGKRKARPGDPRSIVDTFGWVGNPDSELITIDVPDDTTVTWGRYING